MTSEKRGSDDAALIFLHIPKAAGTTLNFIIEEQFDKETSFATSHTRLHPQNDMDAFTALPPQRLAQIKLLYGHMGFGLHKRLPRPAEYVTILRHPTERILSQFYFERREPDSPLYDRLRSGEMDLDDYLHYCESIERDNMQTRMISGNWHKRGHGPVTPAMLATAKKNLREHFAVVGVSEAFDAFYLLLRRRYRWPYTLYPQRNRTKNRPAYDDHPPALQQRLRNFAPYDLELYQYAQTLFAAQVRAQGVSFVLERRAFQAVNTLYHRFGQARTVPVRAVIRQRLHRIWQRQSPIRTVDNQ